LDISTNTAKTKLTPEQQSAVLRWPMKEKIPIIPCDSRNKGFDFKSWPTFDFSTTDFAANLAAGMYDNGIALVLGKTLPGCPYPYSFALDFDGIEAVLEFFGSWDNVLSLSKKTRIEWHQDKGSLHIVFFSNKYVIKKRIKFREKDKAKDKERVPGLEVRSNELLIVSPSIHADGNAWSALGVDMNTALSDRVT
jgi:hypothetical protein